MKTQNRVKDSKKFLKKSATGYNPPEKMFPDYLKLEKKMRKDQEAEARRQTKIRLIDMTDLYKDRVERDPMSEVREPSWHNHMSKGYTEMSGVDVYFCAEICCWLTAFKKMCRNTNLITPEQWSNLEHAEVIFDNLSSWFSKHPVMGLYLRQAIRSVHLSCGQNDPFTAMQDLHNEGPRSWIYETAIGDGYGSFANEKYGSSFLLENHQSAETGYMKDNVSELRGVYRSLYGNLLVAVDELRLKKTRRHLDLYVDVSYMMFVHASEVEFL